MQTKTCDGCAAETREQWTPGWGTLLGTDSFGQHVHHDLCPRCSNVMQLALGEIRKKFTAPVGAASALATAGRKP